ncbi:MAG: glutathione synthase [Janthinobacterium lividum]
MKILFIADPLESFKIYKDTTYTMMSEAAARGHQVFACEARELAYEAGTVSALVSRIEIVGSDQKMWFRREVAQERALTGFDAVLMRQDPPFDMEYVTSTWLLELAERAGARVFNKPQAIRDHSEKLAIGEFPQFVAPTLVTKSAARIRRFHAEHGDVILKPLDGMGGMGIFRVREDAMNLGSIIETLGEDGRRSIMAQRFIPEIKDGDKRILLIGGKPVPFALARVPQGTEIRGNLAAGGVGRAQPLDARDQLIAATLAPVLRDRGLLLVGLDSIGEWLTEVNVTSPTCFREIMDQTGFDVAGMFIDALEEAAGRASSTTPH